MFPHLRWIVAALFVATSVAHAQEPFEYFHYKPKENVLGDVHPYFHNREWFLYSLKPKTFDIELARSKDLTNWTPAPVRLAPTKEGDWKAPYYVLGVIPDPQTKQFRSFFSLPGGRGRIVGSVSTDLLNWFLASKEYTIPPEDHYIRRRDPYVFRIPETGEYGCVMCTQLKSKAGAVSLATSTDLKNWKSHGEILNPGNIGEPECPQMFKLGDRWYLMASLYDRGVGQPSYWIGTKPQGPWEPKRSGVLDGKDLCAAQIAFEGEKSVLFGWIPLVPTQVGAKQYWGGHLALPREVYALKDGTLGTRLHAGVAERMKGKPAYFLNDHRIDANPQVLDGQWDRISMTLNLTMPKDVSEVRFGFDPMGEVVLSRAGNSLVIRDRERKTETKLAINLSSEAPRSLRIVVDGDIVELFLSDRYSLAARLYRTKGITRLRFETTGGAARLEGLEVVKLTGSATAR